AVRGDLEDVTVHTPTGNLLLISEKKYELIFYDPVASEEKKRWHLAPEAMLGEASVEKNQGFEGLTFREDPQAAGGGVVYLTHQRSPATVVGIAFDPQTTPNGPLGADVVVSRWPLKDYQDLTAATYVPELQRFLVIADSRDELLVVSGQGAVEQVFALAGAQQGGLCS